MNKGKLKGSMYCLYKFKPTNNNEPVQDRNFF